MINHDQKQDFKRCGFLVLEDALDDAMIDEARSQVWNTLPCSPEEAPDELHGAGYANANDIEDTSPFHDIRESVFHLVEELVGEDVLSSPKGGTDIPDDMQIPVNYPCSFAHRRTVARRIRRAHLDGYGTLFRDPESDRAGRYEYNTVGATIYLSDVEEGGGGFTVFPGSHWVVSNYFNNHSLESPGWQGLPPALDDSDGGWDYSRTLDEQLVSHEISGPAGTVILSHFQMLHGNGVNQRSMPRIAAVTRYVHKDGQEVKEDAADKPWKYMGELSDIEANIRERPVSHGSYFKR